MQPWAQVVLGQRFTYYKIFRYLCVGLFDLGVCDKIFMIEKSFLGKPSIKKSVENISASQNDP